MVKITAKRGTSAAFCNQIAMEDAFSEALAERSRHVLRTLQSLAPTVLQPGKEFHFSLHEGLLRTGSKSRRAGKLMRPFKLDCPNILLDVSQFPDHEEQLDSSCIHLLELLAIMLKV